MLDVCRAVFLYSVNVDKDEGLLVGLCELAFAVEKDITCDKLSQKCTVYVKFCLQR